MTSRPNRPDLGQLRTRAKKLKRAMAAGEPNAVERVLTHHPKYAGKAPERLVPAAFSLS